MEKQKKKSRHSKQTHNRQYKDRLWRMIFSMLQIIIWWSTMKKESGFQSRNILSFTMVQKNRLSDCFENTDNEAPCLECTATMLNINYGHNQELMKHCRRLEEYSIFVQCVREYIQSEPSVEDALEKAIDTCINQDVLADFLKKHRAEVTNMILTTYDKDLYEKTLKEDAREEGRAEGLMEGRAEIRAELNEFKLLNKYLLKSKRYSDLERATEDIEYQKKLLKELGIE